ncbi:hypothetical protein IAQ61_009804 [Plenodomus lingam]|uniref:uncharacterized protein n=1 Tax=Leptosphaeria maculans TaxID=5022 RepID=UPI00332C67FC|nr:hypothetical protein IAQ61_009804 [Plenodomus lingam]
MFIQEASSHKSVASSSKDSSKAWLRAQYRPEPAEGPEGKTERNVLLGQTKSRSLLAKEMPVIRSNGLAGNTRRRGIPSPCRTEMMLSRVLILERAVDVNLLWEAVATHCKSSVHEPKDAKLPRSSQGSHAMLDSTLMWRSNVGPDGTGMGRNTGEVDRRRPTSEHCSLSSTAPKRRDTIVLRPLIMSASYCIPQY